MYTKLIRKIVLLAERFSGHCSGGGTGGGTGHCS
jgi:hypothetical protein